MTDKTEIKKKTKFKLKFKPTAAVHSDIEKLGFFVVVFFYLDRFLLQ